MDSTNVWTSASAQFITSVIMTSVISLTVYKLNRSVHGKVQKFVVPAATVFFLLLFVLLLVHYSAGTDNLLLTVSAPSLAGFGYSLFYSYSLSKS